MRKPAIPHPNKDELRVIRDNLFSADSIIFLPVGRAIVSVFSSDIIWVESVANYAKFHTYDQYILSPFTMKDLIDKLPADRFVRVSISAIINVSWISWFDKDQIVLMNGMALGFGEGGKNRLSGKINIL